MSASDGILSRNSKLWSLHPAPSDRRKLLTSFWRMMLSASLFHCPRRIRLRPNPFSSSIKRGELFSLFSKWITPCGSDWVSKIGGKIRQSRRHTSSNLPYSEVLGDFPCSLSTMHLSNGDLYFGCQLSRASTLCQSLGYIT